MSKTPNKKSRPGFISAQIQKGQALIEYALILALAFFGLLAILTITAPAVGNVFSNTVYNLLGQTTTPQEPLNPTEFWDVVTSVASYTPDSPPLTPNTLPAPSAEPTDPPPPTDTLPPPPTFTPEDTATPGPSPTPEDTDFDFPFEDDASTEDKFYDEDPDETTSEGPWGAAFWDWGGTGSGNCNNGNIFNAATGETSVSAKAGSIDVDVIDFYWGGAPESGVDDNFCSRFELDMELEAGDYEINYVKDDGIRVYIDDGSTVQRVVNDWGWNPNRSDPQRVTFTNASTRDVTIRVIHFDSGGPGELQFALNKDGEGSSTTCDWQLDNSRFNSPVSAWHDSVGGNYEDDTSCSLTLRGTIDLSTAVEPKLVFYSAYDLANFDDAIVEVAVAGTSNWREYTVHRGGVTNLSFTRQEIDLKNFVDDTSTSYDFTGERIELRFTLRADGSSTRDGWWIDDIEVKEVPEPVYYVGFFRDNAERSPADEDLYWDVEGDWAITTEESRGGSRSWTDRPNNNYNNDSDTSMTLNGRLDLSSDSPIPVEDPEVVFWHQYRLQSVDRISVEASLDKGTWVKMATRTIDGFNTEGSSIVTGEARDDEWSFVRAEIPDSMVGESAVYIRFRLISDNNWQNDRGWFIDDIEFRNKPTDSVNFEYCDFFDTGTSNWILSGDWGLVGAPTYQGSGALHDSPGGNYDQGSNYVAEFVPYLNTQGMTRPVLEFWHQWQLDKWENNGDSLIVEVSADDGETWQQVFDYTDEQAFPGNDTVTLSDFGRYDYNEAWKREVIELYSWPNFPSAPSDPPGLKVRLRVDARNDYWDTADGWWIDSFCFKDQIDRVVPLPFADDMDAGDSNWIPNSNWANVTERARSGSAWSDSPGDGGNRDYDDWTWNILELKPTIDLTGTTTPALYYWVWTRLNDDDRFKVEFIETDVNGRRLTDWAVLPNTRVDGDFENEAFTRYEADLTPYAGGYIRLRFVLDALPNGSTDDGVHLDDVRIIDRAVEEVVNPPNYSENFSIIGFGEWVFEHEWDRVLVDRENLLPPGQWTASWYDGLRTDRGDWQGSDCREYDSDDGASGSHGGTLELDPATFLGTSQHATLNFNWGSGTQRDNDSSLLFTDNDYWGVSFRRTVFFETETTVSFDGYSNNGVRMLVNGVVERDWAFQGWDGRGNGCFYNDIDQSHPQLSNSPYTFPPGVHEIEIQFYETTNTATLQLDFTGQSQALHDSPGGDHDDDINTVAEIEGQIDLTGYGAGDNPALIWEHSYEIHWGDQIYVEVSTDGGFTWTSVYDNDGTDWDWESEVVDLTPYVGQLINLRFRLEALNGDNNRDGWYIDNIEIRN